MTDTKQIASPSNIIPGEIRTYTGCNFNVLNPDPALINIEDIAYALSNQCRFSGHTACFYSVAEHCVHVADNVPERLKLAALLHDASEAYLVDVPTPVKMLMPEYRNLEDLIMQTIASKFGFDFPLHYLVHRADKQMLAFEWNNLMLTSAWQCETSENARLAFLRLFDSLTNK